MIDFEEETDRVKVIPFGTAGNKLLVKRTDPYGFWKISFERGAPPENLKGDYTSFEEAFKNIQTYLRSKGDAKVPEKASDVATK